MNVQIGVTASSILRGANHVVFVEGSNDDAFDPTVIRELLRESGLKSLEVRAIGRCDNVSQAAKAMVWKHPTYYFIADRDGHDAEYVEKGWVDFSRPDTCNLLHWRKRELENYFIDPQYLKMSEWLEKAEEELHERILKEAERRLYLEASNLVLLRIRSEVLIPPNTWFKQVEKFKCREDALSELQNAPGLLERGSEIAACLTPQNREQLFDEIFDDLSGGKAHLEYGTGTWLERLSGKEIFRSIAGQLFRVIDAGGATIHGIEQNNEVAKGLLKMPLSSQPTDFQELVKLLQYKIQEAS